MSNIEQALASQLRNIEAKTGHDLAAIAASGKQKHGEVRAWLMETYGLGYGDANTLAHPYKAAYTIEFLTLLPCTRSIGCQG
ncbi:MAG TPA: DUF4287 domain-containing protein [Longimicrobium sp.]|nr:DUF4287 domain-containing protein [Longimicrobium sp.]